MPVHEVKEEKVLEGTNQNDALAKVREMLQARHEYLSNTLTHEVNIANRYELKVRLDEVVALFNELFGSKN